MLYLPFNHPEACVKTVETYANTPGVIGFSVTSTRFRAVNHDSYMPLYAAIQAIGKPLAFHSGFHWGDQSMQQCNRFISMHAISFVYYNLIHLTNWVINGLPERFPKLKVLWIESGLAWVPFHHAAARFRIHDAVLGGATLEAAAERVHRRHVFHQPATRSSNLKLTEATFEAIKAGYAAVVSPLTGRTGISTCPVRSRRWPFLNEQAKRNILGLNAARLSISKVPKHKLSKTGKGAGRTHPGHRLSRAAGRPMKAKKHAGKPARKLARRSAYGTDFLRGRARRAQAPASPTRFPIRCCSRF